MDAYGHVNNARFLTLYEEARVAMFFIGARKHGLGSFREASSSPATRSTTCVR